MFTIAVFETARLILLTSLIQPIIPVCNIVPHPHGLIKLWDCALVCAQSAPIIRLIVVSGYVYLNATQILMQI